jgi:hypothetical protein
MLLQIVPLVRDVSDDFIPVGQAHLGHLAHRRVRFLGRTRHDLNTHTAAKRRVFQGWRLGLVLDLVTALADQLIDCRHLRKFASEIFTVTSRVRRATDTSNLPFERNMFLELF